jgi:dihydroxy-acid dehydratase
LNIPLYPDAFDELGSKVPCITDVQPAGTRLIDEFDQAGGVPAVIKNLKNLIDGEVITYTGKKLKTVLADAKLIDKNTIKTTDDPVSPAPTLAILSGNLAPGGAVIKVAAASPDLLHHTGIAFVFDNYEEMLKGVEDENLPVDASTVLILRNVGPKAAGMPEWGMIPIPKKLRKQGITDMVRISDARMSGTSFGTVILHVVPEAAVGGPLAFVKNGDKITVDIPNRKLSLHATDEELIKRKNAWQPPEAKHRRGYPKLYFREVLQADEGCDFEFLRPRCKSDLPFAEPVVGRS